MTRACGAAQGAAGRLDFEHLDAVVPRGLAGRHGESLAGLGLQRAALQQDHTGGMPPLSKKSRLNSSALREPSTEGICLTQRGMP